MDPPYYDEIPSGAEEELSELLQGNADVLSTRRIGLPPSAIPPTRIPLRDGVKSDKAKARGYPPKKKDFLSITCQGLASEKLV